MAGCSRNACFDGASTSYRRALWAVIAINATMFCVEITAGISASSQALLADGKDGHGNQDFDWRKASSFSE